MSQVYAFINSSGVTRKKCELGWKNIEITIARGILSEVAHQKSSHCQVASIEIEKKNFLSSHKVRRGIVRRKKKSNSRTREKAKPERAREKKRPDGKRKSKRRTPPLPPQTPTSGPSCPSSSCSCRKHRREGRGRERKPARGAWPRCRARARRSRRPTRSTWP